MRAWLLRSIILLVGYDYCVRDIARLVWSQRLAAQGGVL